MKMVRCALLLLVGTCLLSHPAAAFQGHDWGGFAGLVVPTTPEFSATLILKWSNATANGFIMPYPEGAPGDTKMGGIEIYEIKPTSPDMESYGCASTDSNVAVAFSSDLFTYDITGPYLGSCEFWITWIHERSHVIYTAHFNTWCQSKPTSCDLYKQCISNLGYKGGASPCDEEYAFAIEKKALCDKYQEVCDDDTLTPAQQVDRKAKINMLAQQAYTNCVSNRFNCAACNGPPPPGDFPGCGSLQICVCVP